MLDGLLFKQRKTETLTVLSNCVFDFLWYFYPRSLHRAFTTNTDGLDALLYLDGDCTDAQESNTHEDKRDWPAQ